MAPETFPPRRRRLRFGPRPAAAQDAAVARSPSGEELACPACLTPLTGARSLAGRDRLHGTAGRFSVLICPLCGSGSTFPRVSAERLGAFYPTDYGSHGEWSGSGLLAAISQAIRAFVRRRTPSQAPFSALAGRVPGRLLDVGCGRGDLASIFAARGWTADGLEPSEATCAVARTRGVDARAGTLATVPLEPGRYDAIIFQHSLEHIPALDEDLARVRPALAPGGVVLITVPNFGSWQARVFGSAWFHLDLPRHRTHFTSAGLRRALTRAGLEVVTVSTSTNTVGLPASVQYALAGRCLFPSGLALRVASGLCVVTVPVARLLNAVGGGDQLHAVARAAPSAVALLPGHD